MKTGTLVLAMAGSGILGGMAGALLFLTFFAEDLRPPAPPPAPAAPAESPFDEEETAALRRLPRRVDELAQGIEALRKSQTPAPAGGPGAAVPVKAKEALPDETSILANQTAAVATLRNLASCQAQIQTSGKIDCDEDGIGEYGTLLEMTGSTGVRKGFVAGPPAGSDFSSQGPSVSPPVVSPAMANVDANGLVTKNGYVYMLFLPDTASPAGFVHERSGPGTMGGTGRIAIDYSETTWCMYAWPIENGKSGRNVYFVNQAGDVTQSSNEKAKHSGLNPIDPRSAFRGQGITSMVAVGTRGNDGDVWKVTN
jgi:hypothetical protein